MSHYHLNQALARCLSTTLGCWASIAPTTTCKTQCSPNYCTIWIQPTSMLRGPALVQRWSTISRCWPSAAPMIVRKTTIPIRLLCYLYFNQPPGIHWPPLSCNRTTALAQRRINGSYSHSEQDVGPALGQCLQLVFHLNIYTFFRLSLDEPA